MKLKKNKDNLCFLRFRMAKQFHMYDLHCHTPFSDAQRKLDTIIQGLINIGIKIVGFADHINPVSLYKNPRRFGKDRRLMYNYSPAQLRYRKEVFKRYDRKYSQIQILCGGEIDINLDGSLTLPRGIAPDMFDYLLVVKHHTLPKPLNLYKKFPGYDRWLWKNDIRRRLNTTLWEKGLYQAFRRFQPDVFGHPQEGMPKYISRKKMKRMVLMAKKHGVALELNHFFKKGKHFIPILEYGHELGVKFSLGSDFHGFQDDVEAQLLHSQEMYAIAEKYDLELLDPREFILGR